MSPVKICPGCDNCEGEAHHWLARVTNEDGAIFACRHCDETRSLAEHDHPEADVDARVVLIQSRGSRFDVEDYWRRCNSCRKPIPDPVLTGSVCGADDCEAWLKANAGPHCDEIAITSERYL